MTAIFGPVTALLIGVALLLTGHGLLLTLVPLRAGAEVFGTFQIGLIGSSYYTGFVIGCLAAPFAILRAGHIRAFAAMISLATVAVLILPLSVSPVAWMLARALTGACMAGLYLVIESWLNDRAANHNRGLIMSAYIIVNFTALTVGQLIVTSQPVTSVTLFLFAGLATVLATVPVVMTRMAPPPPITIVRFRPADLYKRTPVSAVGVVANGAVTGAFWALGVIFATGKGLGGESAPIFMMMAIIGGALMQWPVGRLSDKIDRRRVMLGLLVAGAVVGLSVAFIPLGSTGLYIGAALLGATILPLYSVTAAHAFDHADKKHFVETSANVLLGNGLGSVAGPLLASAFVGMLDVGGVFLFTALVQIAFGAFVFIRLRRRPPVAASEKTSFDIAATSLVSGVSAPESFDSVPVPSAAAAPPPTTSAPAPPPAPSAPALKPRPAASAADVPEAEEVPDGERRPLPRNATH